MQQVLPPSFSSLPSAVAHACTSSHYSRSGGPPSLPHDQPHTLRAHIATPHLVRCQSYSQLLTTMHMLCPCHARQAPSRSSGPPSRKQGLRLAGLSVLHSSPAFDRTRYAPRQHLRQAQQARTGSCISPLRGTGPHSSALLVGPVAAEFALAALTSVHGGCFLPCRLREAATSPISGSALRLRN